MISIVSGALSQIFTATLEHESPDSIKAGQVVSTIVKLRVHGAPPAPPPVR